MRVPAMIGGLLGILISVVTRQLSQLPGREPALGLDPRGEFSSYLKSGEGGPANPETLRFRKSPSSQSSSCEERGEGEDGAAALVNCYASSDTSPAGSSNSNVFSVIDTSV